MTAMSDLAGGLQLSKTVCQINQQGRRVYPVMRYKPQLDLYLIHIGYCWLRMQNVLHRVPSVTQHLYQSAPHGSWCVATVF